MIKLQDILFNERKLSSHQKKAILIAIEMSGNMTGATKKIEKIKTGLSKDKKVEDALRLANESVKRDYKKEYKKYGSSTKAKKYRAELNQYNRKRGTYGNGDGKDASHKGGKIVGFEKESTNRGRREKSRLKSEGRKTLKHYDQIVGGIQQAIEGMRALQDKINNAPYNSKWGKITDMLYKKELDFQNMLRRSIPQVKNIAQDKILESTDTFDYNDMTLEMIEAGVMGHLRTWRQIDTIMENDDAYKILKKCDKIVQSYMKKCDKELRKLK
jgi:hypothetical protein